jgi:hypothetical protein
VEAPRMSEESDCALGLEMVLCLPSVVGTEWVVGATREMASVEAPRMSEESDCSDV